MFFIWHGLNLLLSKYGTLILVSKWANPLTFKIIVPNYLAFRKGNPTGRIVCHPAIKNDSSAILQSGPVG
jgi:hypothetical protein